MAKILGTRSRGLGIDASSIVSGFTVIGLRRQIPLNGALIQLTYIANRTNKMSKNWGNIWKNMGVPANLMTPISRNLGLKVVLLYYVAIGLVVFSICFLIFYNVLPSLHLENGSILTGRFQSPTTPMFTSVCTCVLRCLLKVFGRSLVV